MLGNVVVLSPVTLVLSVYFASIYVALCFVQEYSDSIEQFPFDTTKPLLLILITQRHIRSDEIKLVLK